ncbi:MAG: L-threonylcarbamoyladenylate synthase [Steroidobacteraceae bacterium]
MGVLLPIHPKNPQARAIGQAGALLRAGGVVAYPTDSCYALGAALGWSEALERMRDIRQCDKRHFFTLVCRSLSEASRYARIDNQQFRLLKAHTPGPYTFVLLAGREVPRQVFNTKQRTLGIRLPDHPCVQALLAELDGPLISTTLYLPGDELPITEGDEAHSRVGKRVDAVLDAGHCGIEPTTVVDLTEGYPQILRRGKGDCRAFE